MLGILQRISYIESHVLATGNFAKNLQEEEDKIEIQILQKKKYALKHILD